MVDRVVVPFAGAGSGVEELSWGQREIWDLMQYEGGWLPIGSVRPLPAGTTVADAVADLRFVVSSYQTMRTLIRTDPAGPKQVVHDSGEITLEIVDAADDADPAQLAEEVFAQYQQKDYDVATEWPVRMAVIRHRGVLTHRAWVMCHLVTDGAGANVIVRELAQRDAAGSAAALAPIEQARWQRSPAGQRQCRAALAHWEKVLRTKPACQFPERADKPRGPRYWRATFDSPAMYRALRVIAARTGAESVSVLLAVYAVALVRVLGVNPVVIQLVTNNRFRPRLGNTVSPLIQAAPCTIEIPDATIDEAVRLTRTRAISAYKYAYYDPTQLDALIARLSEERGADLQAECGFNDRRLGPRDESGPVPTHEQVRAALPGSSFEWVQRQDDEPYSKLYINVEDATDTYRLTVTTDIHYLSPEQVEACVRAMEEIAVASALDPATRTNAGPPGQAA
jgi:hypothetical protein